MRGRLSPRPLALAVVLRCDGWDHFRPGHAAQRRWLGGPGRLRALCTRGPHPEDSVPAASWPWALGRPLGREETRLQGLRASGLLAASELAPCLPRAQRGQCGQETTGAMSRTYRIVYADIVSERTAALNIAPFDKYSVNTLSRGYTHSSVLAWRIPGTEEPGGRPSMGSHRVGRD